MIDIFSYLIYNYRNSLCHQVELALARAESEGLARRISEETTADLEKEKAVRELEVQDSERQLRSDLADKEEAIIAFKNKENEYSKTIEVLTIEKEELSAKIHFMNQGIDNTISILFLRSHFNFNRLI